VTGKFQFVVCSDSTGQYVFIAEHHFRVLSLEAVKQEYQVHFPDAAVLKKSTIFRHVNQRRHFSQSLYGYVETG
jgi:hypothetical protein